MSWTWEEEIDYRVCAAIAREQDERRAELQRRAVQTAQKISARREMRYRRERFLLWLDLLIPMMAGAMVGGSIVYIISNGNW